MLILCAYIEDVKCPLVQLTLGFNTVAKFMNYQNIVKVIGVILPGRWYNHIIMDTWQSFFGKLTAVEAKWKCI